MSNSFSGILQLIPDNVPAAAVIAVVILFLKHGSQILAGHQAAMLSMSKDFAEQIQATRQAFSFELRRVTDLFTDRHDAMLHQVRDLGESNQSTATAVNGLRDEIRELKESQQRHQGRL